MTSFPRYSPTMNMKMMIPRFVAVLLVAAAASAASAAGPKIAVVAPADGNLRILGDQLRLGASFAARGAAEIVEITETCAEGSGPALAEEIVRSDAVAAIGFLCTESLQDGLPRLAKADIPAITLSIRSEVLMQDALKNGWPFFRMAPSTSDERDAVADAIFTHWKDKPFALLDDGTILSREMTDMVRQTLEQKGMSPAFVDNFRPAQEVQTQLVRRLVKANVTHVFAASDRNDMSVLARDARQAGARLTLLGGDALKGMDQPVPLEAGVQAVTLPDPATLASAADAVNLMSTEKKVAEGYTLPAFSAVQVVVDASEIAAGSGARLVEALVDTPFETAIGTVRFGADHELAENPYRLLVWDGNAFVEPKVTQ